MRLPYRINRTKTHSTTKLYLGYVAIYALSCVVILYSSKLLATTLSQSSLPYPIPSSLELPAIAIIIDDLGNSLSTGMRAINLPGAIACSFLPHTPHSYELAIKAHSQNKLVMLHQPMESSHHVTPGPGGLTEKMGYDEFYLTFKRNLEAIPYASGVNNHMGSLLTQIPRSMQWLMQAISLHHGLFFIDSVTTSGSIAHKVAQHLHIPNLKRDLFLDHKRDLISINQQFTSLIKLAKKKGFAIAIGHPYDETLTVLEKRIPALHRFGIRLIPLTDLLHKQIKRLETWQAYSSH